MDVIKSKTKEVPSPMEQDAKLGVSISYCTMGWAKILEPEHVGAQKFLSSAQDIAP